MPHLPSSPSCVRMFLVASSIRLPSLIYIVNVGVLLHLGCHPSGFNFPLLLLELALQWFKWCISICCCITLIVLFYETSCLLCSPQANPLCWKRGCNGETVCLSCSWFQIPHPSGIAQRYILISQYISRRRRPSRAHVDLFVRADAHGEIKGTTSAHGFTRYVQCNANLFLITCGT